MNSMVTLFLSPASTPKFSFAFLYLAISYSSFKFQFMCCLLKSSLTPSMR